MHHTFDPNHTVPNSRRVVKTSSVILTVDCLFHASKGFFQCSRNKDSVSEVLKQMDLPKDVSLLSTWFPWPKSNKPKKDQDTEYQMSLRVQEQSRELQDKVTQIEKLQEKLGKNEKQLEDLKEDRDKQTAAQGQKINYLLAQIEILKGENSTQTTVSRQKINKLKEDQDRDNQEMSLRLREQSRELQDKAEQIDKLHRELNEMKEKQGEKEKQLEDLREERDKQTADQGQMINDLLAQIEILKGENSTQTTGKTKMETFYTHVAGKTLGSHEAFVHQLIQGGATEVDSPDKSDVVIVFCPIVSCLETDINTALSTTTGLKPVILVVMYHTFDPNYTVPNSRRVVKTSSVILTVDCLFHDSKGFFQCSRNKDAVSEVLKQLFPCQTHLHGFLGLKETNQRYRHQDTDNQEMSLRKQEQSRELQDKAEQNYKLQRELNKMMEKLGEKEKQLEDQRQMINDLLAEIETER